MTHERHHLRKEHSTIVLLTRHRGRYKLSRTVPNTKYSFNKAPSHISQGPIMNEIPLVGKDRSVNASHTFTYHGRGVTGNGHLHTLWYGHWARVHTVEIRPAPLSIGNGGYALPQNLNHLSCSVVGFRTDEASNQCFTQ